MKIVISKTIESKKKKAPKGVCWKNYEMVGTKEKNGKEVPNCVPKKKPESYFSIEKTAKWEKRKEHENPEGGLNQKGRDSYNKETGGNLKRPVSKEEADKSPKAAKRRKSFCARMKGMKQKMTGSEKKNDPDSRINKSLRKWDC